eukprot:2703006-Prymnesium_polylepis.1
MEKFGEPSGHLRNKLVIADCGQIDDKPKDVKVSMDPKDHAPKEAGPVKIDYAGAAAKGAVDLE